MPRWVWWWVWMLAWLPSVASAQATTMVRERLAVLEFTARDGALSVSDLKVLANGARAAASQSARADVLVMTVEVMLTLQEDLGAPCKSEGSCAVDTGRLLNATLVLDGQIGRFGGELVLDLQLYNVLSGALLSAEQIRSTDIGRLLDGVGVKTPLLLARGGFASPEAAQGFSFDAGGLSGSVQAAAAAEAARQAELEAAAKEAECQEEARQRADEKQAVALKDATAKLAAEVDVAWRPVCEVLTRCLAVQDTTTRATCGARAKGFVAQVQALEASAAAARHVVTTACGSRTQATGSKKGAVTSPHTDAAQSFAALLAAAHDPSAAAPRCPARTSR